MENCSSKQFAYLNSRNNLFGKQTNKHGHTSVQFIIYHPQLGFPANETFREKMR